MTWPCFRRARNRRREFEVVVFAPGGSMFDQKVAGRVKFDDIVLEKGILQDGTDEATLDWLKQEVDVNATTGGLPNEWRGHSQSE